MPGVPPEDVVIPVIFYNNVHTAQKPMRLNEELTELVRKDLKRQEKLGLISKTICCPWGSPIHTVKKLKGGIRICIDYRVINQRTVPDKYPQPRLEDILIQAAGCKYLTSLDFPSAFQQLHIHPEHKEKLAFVTPFGQYKLDHLIYGFIN